MPRPELDYAPLGQQCVFDAGTLAVFSVFVNVGVGLLNVFPTIYLLTTN